MEFKGMGETQDLGITRTKVQIDLFRNPSCQRIQAGDKQKGAMELSLVEHRSWESKFKEIITAVIVLTGRQVEQRNGERKATKCGLVNTQRGQFC
jgi:hypothetical protein